MSPDPVELEARCARTLAKDLGGGGELPLHEAYEIGREALECGVGVLEMALVLWRVARLAQGSAAGASVEVDQQIEGFLLESLSPFEMAYRGVREANETLRRLDGRREEEARRIAHELHDQAGQLLATVHLALEELRRHLAPEGEAHLGRAFHLLRLAEDEIRRLSHELRPLLLDDLGLMPALRVLGEGIARRSRFAIQVKGSTAGRLPNPVETAVYRSVQEALNNVARHANAEHVLIEVENSGNELRCRVHDDGVGFDPLAAGSPRGRRGIGLDGIRERLAPLRGRLVIDSKPGRGSELLLHIPLEVTHAHPDPARGRSQTLPGGPQGSAHQR